jgi:hypothetical protein
MVHGREFRLSVKIPGRHQTALRGLAAACPQVTQKIIDSSRHTGLIWAVAALQLPSNRLWHARLSSTGFYPARSATMRKHVNELLQAEHAG